MMRMKRWLPVLAAAALLSGIPVMDAEAARKKVKTVSVTIESEIEIGQEIDEDAVSVEASSDKYAVGEHTFLNGGFRWEETDEPVLEIALYAEDDYYFSLDKENVYLKGDKAELQSIRKEDSSSTLILKVKLESMANSVGSIDSVTMDNTGLAYWEPSMAATGYELRLYKDDKIMGQTKRTEHNMYSFAPAIKKNDSYCVVVRAVKELADGTEEKGSWVQSNSVYISTDTLDAAAAPQKQVEIQGTWMEDTGGRWYQYPNGSYPKNQWVTIFGKWYFFNEQGYMVTGWIDWNDKQYYCSTETGEMLVNTETPDGARVGLDGSRQ